MQAMRLPRASVACGRLPVKKALVRARNCARNASCTDTSTICDADGCQYSVHIVSWPLKHSTRVEVAWGQVSKAMVDVVNVEVA